MQLARIGVVAGTPPADLLARKGLAGQIRGYELMVDSRVEQPARQTIEDLANGQLDAALVWGPIAGYWAKQQQVPITLVPLESDPRSGLRLDFRISMGIRPSEPEWKHQINDMIRELQPQIQSILLDYGVPLLDEQDRPITAEWHGVGGCIHCPGARGLSDGQVPDAGASDAGRGDGAVDGRTAATDRRAAASPGRRTAQAAQAKGPGPGADLDRAQAGAYPGLGLATQCRLGRAVAGLRRLVRHRARAS